MRRALLFTFDALLGSLVILAALLLFLQFRHEPVDATQTSYYARDVVTALNAINVRSLNDSWVQARIADGTIDPERSVLEQIGAFWASNATSDASNLTRRAIDELMPPNVGYSFSFEDDELFSRGSGNASRLTAGRRMVTGIERGRAISGATSAAYLSRIEGRELSKYIYFGGFVGQGNLSAWLELPGDVNSSAITNITFEGDVEADFDLFMNGVQCLGTFSPVWTGDNFTPDTWEMTSCKSLLQNGTNSFRFAFDDVNDAYIGGGYLRVSYRSSAFRETEELGVEQKRLPGINGIVNLYDSFTVPGNLTNLSVHLHYFANHSNATNLTFYMTIGNETVYADTNSTTPQRVTLPPTNLSVLNYSELSRTTVPVRIGFQNLSFSTSYTGNADVTIVTDVSGSMDWRMDTNSGGTARNCNESGYNTSSTARLSVAKCLDRTFAQDILNITGNRVGLVSYDGSTHGGETISPTRNTSLINATVGTAVPETGYEASGGTCICCGINSAASSLAAASSRTVVIPAGSTWKYDDSHLLSRPPKDAENDTWHSPAYDESWSSGPAILGATNSYVYAPAVTTELAAELGATALEGNLWEHVLDNPGAPNDFSGGTLNSTANTFGHGAGDDGWDWDPVDSVGPFGEDDDFTYPGVVSGRLSFGNNPSNVCTSYDCSGAYGIQVNVTPAEWNVLASGGRAMLSFEYTWTGPGGSNPYEDADEVWVKAAWVNQSGGWHYLGSEMSNEDGDTTSEVANADNPDTDLIGGHEQEVTSWIDGPGTYYLVLGGRLAASQSAEWGIFTFDNIQLLFEEDDPYRFNADLWEHVDDVPGAPNDFSGGTLNSTANTYGLGAGDDGWDWDVEDGNGPFGYDDDYDYTMTTRLHLDNDQGGNSCSSYDCSGAYAIQVEVTPAMYALIADNGTAQLTFDYEWDDRPWNYFENADEVWVKARWTSPTTGGHMLGTNADAGHEGADAEPDIDARNNPDTDFTGTYSGNIAEYIEGPGTYYLELGGKLLASQSAEHGTWSFDNLELVITNRTNSYYFRKNFTYAGTAGRGVLNVLSDDRARIYLNGKLVAETLAGDAEYWNGRGLHVPGSLFKSGENTVAVELRNANAAAKFDLELAVINTSRSLAQMVMSDGEATVDCPGDQGTGSATEDAVEAACDAREEWGITVYAVGYSDAADEATMRGIAECGGGTFKKSDNTDELEEFYTDVAFSIIEASVQSQTVVVTGTYEESVLYNDSYINITYEPPYPGNLTGIELVFQTEQFDSCNPTVRIHPGVRLIDAVITSYSGEHWTNLVTANGDTAFNLSRFNPVYANLGDPYLVGVPVDMLVAGNNTFTISTGDSAANTTGCSDNNTLIYRGFVNTTTPRSAVVERKVGCNWTIDFEDGTTLNTAIPSDYSGPKNCSYTNTTYPGSYDALDAYDVSVAQVLNDLDFDDDGRVLVNLADEDLQIIVTLVEGVPYLWGPSFAKVEVWE